MGALGSGLQTGVPDKCYKILVLVTRIEALEVKYLCVWAALGNPAKLGSRVRTKKFRVWSWPLRLSPSDFG